VQRARWAGTGWSGAWELDFWLRLLPLLSDAATTEPTLRVRAGASDDAASVRERAVAVARALDETPPRAWPLVDASGARLDEAAVCRELARLASARNERESLGVAAMLWLRARSHSAARSARQAPAPRDPTREASGERAPAATVAPDSPPATAAGACSSIVLEVRSLDRGGLESVVVELALALGAEGISTAVVCTERGGSEVERLRSAGVEVVVLGAADRGAELAAWLDGRDVDLWNAHYSDLGAPLAALRGIPVVVTIHNEYAWVPNRPDDTFRRVDAVVDAYVAVSESAAAFAAERFAIARERIGVIRNALPRRAALASAAFPRPRAAPQRELGSASPKRPSSWSRSAASIPSSRRWSWSTPWPPLPPRGGASWPGSWGRSWTGSTRRGCGGGSRTVASATGSASPDGAATCRSSSPRRTCSCFRR
jgi:hypothetical protein